MAHTMGKKICFPSYFVSKYVVLLSKRTENMRNFNNTHCQFTCVHLAKTNAILAWAVVLNIHFYLGVANKLPTVKSTAAVIVCTT